MALRPFKIWNSSRTIKKTVVASSFEMLIERGAEKLELQKNGLKLILEEDGSEVDSEYFAFLLQNTVLQLLAIDEKWESHAEVTKDQSVKIAASDVRKETVSNLNVKSRQKTITSTGALGPPLSLSCKTPTNVTLPVDIGMLKDQAKIYSLIDTNEKLYNYHKAINEAAYQIALENPMIVGNKTELNKLAVAKLDIDGYSYRKKKSRSKQLNPDVDTPKRAKIQSDFRASRIKEVSEDLTEVDKQVQLCTK
ncbi:DNA fragmentation factor subunit alpha-like [Paramuricea clavata]|uniref:DNAation factor subunit alpha-like n=1 Tax=Paramuricea clavata TaxID=317549 RepID=A0A6S7FWS2_PARCT|nr:DNA fragmentation factor subunit alpha-like [Paramuricea clavata]